MQTCVLIFMGNFGHITLWIAKHCQNKGFSEEWLFNVQNNRTSNELVRWIHKGDNIDCVTKLQQDYIDLDLNMWIVKSWNQIKQAGKIQTKLVEDINSNSGGVANCARKQIIFNFKGWNTLACNDLFNYVGGFPSYNPSPVLHLLERNKSERPVDALAVKTSLSHLLTTWNQEMLAHLKIPTSLS